MLTMFLMSLSAHAVEPPPPSTPPAPEVERDLGMRLYISGGDAVVGTSHGAFASLGAQVVQQGGIIGGALGAELSAFQPSGSEGVLPVINLDASLRLTPWPDGRVVPYVSGGLGVSVLIIIPFPDLTLSLGAELPLGELRLYAELHGRSILPLYPGTEQVNVSSLRLGVGF